jgi:phospholipase C
MNRSALLGVLAVLCGGLVTGCSNDDESPAAPAGPLPGPTEWNREVSPPADAEAEQKRAACEYQAGALPAETQGASHPMGSDIPVDHVVIVMMENRSFDHYFQKLPEHGQPDVDVAPSDFTNPDADGQPVGLTRDDLWCFVDTEHGWGGTHFQINDGAMDGFVVSNENNHELPVNGTLDMLSGNRGMTYYEQADIPFYFWLANEFSISDRYFSSVAGPTWPNRMYLFAATSFGKFGNSLPDADKTLPDYLSLRELHWKIYSSTTPSYGMFLPQYLASKDKHQFSIDEFYADAAAGTLPPVAFVEPGIGREGDPLADDEHPPAIMQVGQEFVAKVTKAMLESPAWGRSAMFVTYDEHGGVYDHVAPPKACAPDDLAEPDAAGNVPTFDHLGVRVPFFVVSPYAKKHFVSHRTYDHTSIVRFVQARFQIPALTGRDANAEAPWDMFDFEGAPHMQPPTMTMPTIDQAKVDNCMAIWNK